MKVRYLMAVISLACVGGGLFYAFPSQKRLLADSCENIFVNRLKSPSSYKRIGVEFYKVSPASLEDFLGKLKYSNSDWMTEAQRFNERGKMDVHRLYIKYDAQNGFGAVIRGAVECSIVVSAGSKLTRAKTNSPLGVRVDGFSSHEWQLQLVRDAYKAGVLND